MSETVMSSKGQVVIPAKVRRALGLAANVRFRVEEQDGVIVLIPIKETDWRSLRGLFKGESLTRLLEKERRADRRRES